ncbi:MAG: transcription-repair coupling factor [Saccharofermentanales bacterium]
MLITTNEKIFSYAARDPEYRKLRDHILYGKSGAINANGLSDSLKSYLWMALAWDTKHKPCILASDELRARSLSEELRGYVKGEILIFRQRELNLIDADASSRESEIERLDVMMKITKGEFDVLIITGGGSLSKLMPADDFISKIRTVHTGETIDSDEFCKALLDMGYERTRTVEGPGQFAWRGDIIDVVPPGMGIGAADEKSGIRISFFDDEIDAIKKIDINSQRSVEMLQEASFGPAREILIRQERRSEIATAIRNEKTIEARTMQRRDAQKIEEGVSFSGVDRYISLIYPDAQSIFDYIPKDGTFVAVDELIRVRNRMDAYLADFYERFKVLLSKGGILPCSEDILYKGVDILRQLDKRDLLIHFASIASSGNGFPKAENMTLAGRECDSYRAKETKLIIDIKDRSLMNKETILMISNEARRERLQALFDEWETPVVFADYPIQNGFEYMAASVLFVGSNQIFGTERPIKKRHTKGIKIDLFSDLQPGDLVVHESHGIGKYIGLMNIESNGIKRDYLKIEYHGSDTLYIPTESFDQIQKYVGSQGREPRLSKLGGQDWNRLKDKARDSIKKLATNLVKLYAERVSKKGFKFLPDTVWQQEFEESFPYEETADQLKSIQEIKADMESDKVMDRLLCGDVGFGKTEVAFRCIFKCVMDGKQAAILVPTTVLAQQHYENLKERLSGFPIQVGLLSRFASDAMIKETKHDVSSGKVDIVIGTHRILSKDINFKDLGLLVIDEEQRFGVDHKEHLKELFPAVDVLTLTATPIPRTLHMSMSGIRDISVLEEPPPDRRSVQTYVMEYDEGIIAEALLREISRKGQVFYLFNDTRKMNEKVAMIERMIPGARVTYAHGKMGERQLEDVVNSFIKDEADILVCTTIIESGIDMPNVNTIIVEDADKLGLAQLYQLRGRVGRSDRQAYAYVTYRQDRILTEIAEKRLAAIRDFTELGSGFKIALRDLEVRGAGNLLGAEQHGNLDAIGYDLYCKMLEEEIHAQTGIDEPVHHEASVEIEIDAYIPKYYVPDEGQRMDMYRRLAEISDSGIYYDVLDEITDRFGELPSQIITLADIAYIRAIAASMGFSRVWEKSGSVVFTYREGITPDMQIISRLLNIPGYKGQILFNAGTKPYLVFRNIARIKTQAPSLIRALFMDYEKSGGNEKAGA